jgi:hypothetical protein
VKCGVRNVEECHSIIMKTRNEEKGIKEVDMMR